jgi:hypothetical protein
VKHDVVDPEYDDIPLGGWRGKVIEVRYLNPPSYLIRWDAETLANIHNVYKKRCQRDGSEYREMWFYEEDLEPDPGGPLEITQPTQIVTRPLSMDEQEDRIRAVFGLTTDDPLPRRNKNAERTYHSYLRNHLSFPFEAKYWAEGSAVSGLLRPVTITGMRRRFRFDEDFGIPCEASGVPYEEEVPVTELEIEEGSPNFQLIDDYVYWFAQLDIGEESDEDDEEDGEDEWDEDDPEDRVASPGRKRKVAKDEPCPCGSGKQYGDCCYEKDFEYLVDEDGTIFKSIPMSGELAEVLEEQKRKFVETHGREPGPGDNLFFDMPPLEHVEHYMVEGMKQAGLDPGIIYAFEKTGLLVTEANEHLISDKDRAEWEAAILEYRAKQGNEGAETDEENEWF